MAREFENLEILINVLNQRALDNIDKLIRRIETLDAASDRVRRIPIKVNVKDRELDMLLGKLATLEGSRGTSTRDIPQTAQDDFLKEGSRTMVLAANRHLQAAQSLKNAAKQLKLSSIKMAGIGGRGGGGGGGMGANKAAFAMEDVVQELQRLEQVRTGIRRGGMADITRKTSVFNLKMRDINNALAKIAPLLWTITASLPALASGLLGLTTAALGAAMSLATIAGLGFLGAAAERGGGTPSFEAAMEIMGEIGDAFLDAMLPISKRFVPMFERSMDGMGMFFEDMAEAFRGLLDLRDTARTFGRFMGEYLVNTTKDMIQATQIMLPVFEQLAATIRNTSMLRFLVNSFMDLWPTFTRLGREALTLLPRIIAISQGFLQVSSMIMTVLDTVLWVITGFGRFEQGLGRVIGTLLVMTTVLSVINALYSTQLIPALGSVIAKLGLKIAALLGYNKVLVASAVALWWTTAALWTKVAAVVALGVAIAIATAGISLLVGALAGAGAGAATATKNLKGFNDELGRVEGQRTADRRPEFAASRESFARANGGTTVNATINVREDDTDDVDTAVNNLAWRVKK